MVVRLLVVVLVNGPACVCVCVNIARVCAQRVTLSASFNHSGSWWSVYMLPAASQYTLLQRNRRNRHPTAKTTHRATRSCCEAATCAPPTLAPAKTRRQMRQLQGRNTHTHIKLNTNKKHNTTAGWCEVRGKRVCGARWQLQDNTHQGSPSATCCLWLPHAPAASASVRGCCCIRSATNIAIPTAGTAADGCDRNTALASAQVAGTLSAAVLVLAAADIVLLVAAVVLAAENSVLGCCCCG